MLDLPLVIVGSRLQAITAFAVGAAVAVALAPEQPAWWIAVLALGVFGLSRMVMRLELGHERASWRTWQGSVDADRSTLDADVGHRYLRLGAPSGKSIKIEVPVEIRPNVRVWVDQSG